MKKTDQSLHQDRRDFIKKSTLLGAGAAAATLASGEVLAISDIEESEAPKDKGYQLSQHVIDYYKSAAS